MAGRWPPPSGPAWRRSGGFREAPAGAVRHRRHAADDRGGGAPRAARRVPGRVRRPGVLRSGAVRRQDRPADRGGTLRGGGFGRTSPTPTASRWCSIATWPTSPGTSPTGATRYGRAPASSNCSPHCSSGPTRWWGCSPATSFPAHDSSSGPRGSISTSSGWARSDPTAPRRPDLPAIAASRAEALFGRVPTGREVVIIGDTPADVTCGAGIGARAVAVATGGFSRNELEAAGAHAVFDSFTDTAASLGAIVA